MLFLVPNSDITIEITSKALITFEEHKQRKHTDSEAGGQLFARIEGNHWIIENLTTPSKKDIRFRTGFRPNRKVEQKDIESAFKDGLHFVGDWHTHPEKTPTPSYQDQKSMKDMYLKSEHQLPGFVMIIIGNGKTEDLWFSMHTASLTGTKLIKATDNK